MRGWIWVSSVAFGVTAAGCGGYAPSRNEAERASAAAEDETAQSADQGVLLPPASKPAMSPSGGQGGERGLKREEARADGALPPPDVPAVVAEEAAESRTREWFPEAFLWQPLVETGPEGRARVPVVVPDQLTTWRVLALAHDRGGRQAGAVHGFDSRLALYADPVIPAFLHVGDVIGLPVQLVNATDADVTGALRVDAEGSLSGGGSGPVHLGPGGSDLVAFQVDARAPGIGRIRAALTGSDVGDAVVREIPVIPRGKPVDVVRGGRLAGSRTVALDGPDAGDPTSRELEVRVYGGSLGLIQAELGRLGASGVADGAYAWALSARAGTLAAGSGATLDPKVLRRLELLGWQRIVRDARNPTADVAADLLAGLAVVEGNALVDELRVRLVDTVARGQRGDGTWSRRPEATLQEVIVETAWVARALPASATVPRRRAAGALERFAPEIADPYTASVVLASGLIEGDRGRILGKIVSDALVTAPDGARTLPVPGGVKNPWGLLPSRTEALTWAALGLPEGDDRGDLVGQVMGGYRGEWGFAAGKADCVALELVAGSLPGVSEPVEVALYVDGAEVARSKLDPSQPLVPAALLARGTGSDPTVELRATPATAGLAWSMRLRSYVPWSEEDRLPGVDVEVSVPSLRVGRSGDLRIEVAAPAGVAVELEQGLPPGITLDPAAWAIPPGARVEVGVDRLRIALPPGGAGEVAALSIPVDAAFTGSFTTAPLVVRASGQEVISQPSPWVIR